MQRASTKMGDGSFAPKTGDYFFALKSEMRLPWPVSQVQLEGAVTGITNIGVFQPSIAACKTVCRRLELFSGIACPENGKGRHDRSGQDCGGSDQHQACRARGRNRRRNRKAESCSYSESDSDPDPDNVTQAALSGSQIKATGFAGGYLLAQLFPETFFDGKINERASSCHTREDLSA